jgi:hypothetical protein
MGLLDDQTQNQYYQGNDYGNYQFTSLDHIITQFQIAYVGEGKIIQKVKRADIAFHAQRGLQEFSFDTFKSIKAQQIDVPATLQMILPQDYVNYTKLSWVDSAGIKHPLHPTKYTSNPFEITQSDDGSYFFGEEGNNVINPDFDASLSGTWNASTPGRSHAWDSIRESSSTPPKYYTNYIYDTLTITNGELEFGVLWNNGYGVNGGSRAYGVWQRVDVEFASTIELKATATSGAQQTDSGGTLICDYGIVRVGITSTDPSIGWDIDGSGTLRPATNTAIAGNGVTPNNIADNYDLGYVEWTDGTTSQKEIEEIDVSGHTEIWVYIQSHSPWTEDAKTDLTAGVANGGTTVIDPTESTNNTHQKNTVDFVSVVVPGQIQNLTHVDSEYNSSTWNNYKSTTPSENNNDDYEDDTYWPLDGSRYGLDPQHAQANGSFYIDPRLGRIHFSSNISGKTVILDYVSDSLGTDAEMQVHKFAEEAMYKYIAYAILSTSSQPIHQQLAPRFKKERFAETRKAKLRLSNIKLEELTQILRGKSKQIKH